MFAVVKTGGKQYKVSQNDILKLEKLEGEVGSKIKLEDVLLVNDDKKGIITDTSSLKKVSVTAEILEQKRDKKVIIFKKKRRKNHRRKNGHRQDITIVKVLDINSGASTAPKTAKKEESTDKAEKSAPQSKTSKEGDN